MEAIRIRPELLENLERSAEHESKTVSELINQVLERYLFEEEEQKLEQEAAAYEAMHPELKQKHFGQWVAVHEQKLIDFDSDRAALYRRIQSKYGNTVVLIRQVREEPIEQVWIRTPSTGRIEP